MKDKKVKSLSCVWLFETQWTVAYQAPLSMGFSRQEYWDGLLFPSPGDLPDPGIEPRSPLRLLDPGQRFTIWATREVQMRWYATIWLEASLFFLFCFVFF